LTLSPVTAAWWTLGLFAVLSFALVLVGLVRLLQGALVLRDRAETLVNKPLWRVLEAAEARIAISQRRWDEAGPLLERGNAAVNTILRSAGELQVLLVTAVGPFVRVANDLGFIAGVLAIRARLR